MKENELIFSDKPIEKFVYSALRILSVHEDIVMKSSVSNIGKLEVVKQLLESLGVKEISRKNYKYTYLEDVIDAVEVVMTKSGLEMFIKRTLL